MTRARVAPDMDLESQRDLQVLEAVSENQRVTQRGLAANLGIALGLANVYVKRLARKGYIKCINVQSNRILYLITPKGLAEKTRLTYEYMQYSLHLYGQVRIHLRAVLQPLADAGHRRIAIYGTGEAAELAYLSVKEAGLELAAIFGDEAGQMFLGMPVQEIREQHLVPYDLLVIAALDRPEAAVNQLLQLGVPLEKLQTLRPSAGARAQRAGGNSGNGHGVPRTSSGRTEPL
jgi:DNA-binding MarR family transcriptional regulator